MVEFDKAFADKVLIVSARLEHYHLEYRLCTDYTCDGSRPDMFVPMGPITGMRGVAAELMRHFGFEPTEHQDVWSELEQAIGEEMLDTGRDILTEHGLLKRPEPAASLSAPPSLDAPTAVSWNDLAIGQVIRYYHRNRSQRLGHRAPQIRIGRILDIWHPSVRANPNIKLLVLNQDGTTNRTYFPSHTLYHRNAIEDVIEIVHKPAPAVESQDLTAL